MALFFVYADRPELCSSTGRSAAAVAAADASAALALAHERRPDGETTVAGWRALEIGEAGAAFEAGGALAGGVLWLQGSAAEPLQLTRGG